jgi:succinate dehydrogenase / fumarate reductase iron-sulfur subunit
MDVTLRIRRFNPETDRKPRYQDYKVRVTEGMTVLDAINEIKWKQDGTLSHRMSCRSMICGSCAMCINGRNRLACGTRIEAVAGSSLRKVIRVDPLPGYKVIKDLTVDMRTFFENLERVKPYLITETPPPLKERLQSPEAYKVIDQVLNCILCGACSSSCPSVWMSPEYLGPAAITKAYRFVADSRDEGEDERLGVLSDETTGVWRCHTIYNCVDACPKEIDTTWAIGQIKLRLMRKAF